jgi:MFS family permease
MSRLPRNVLALAAVSFLTDASSELIAPLLPLVLTTTLGATPTMIGMIEGAAESTAALLKLVSGRWSDRLSRRKPLVVAGYTIASVVRPLVAFATSSGQVLAIRLLDRVGKGVRGAPRDAMIADAVGPGERGRAFGAHRAADHAGAVVGPLLAWWLLSRGVAPRELFAWAAVPGALAVVVAVFGVREQPRVRGASTGSTSSDSRPLPARFWGVLAAIALFTLGNATDAFLLLRASELGIPTTQLPLLWGALHLIKSASSTPAGALSDRVGRIPLVVAGWIWYAVMYVGFAAATTTAHVWLLFGGYGMVFGLTEGSEKALIADLATPSLRGTAFGWYQLCIGIAALPASMLFGVVWTARGAAQAFQLGAGFAVAAIVLLLASSRLLPRSTESSE